MFPAMNRTCECEAMIIAPCPLVNPEQADRMDSPQLPENMYGIAIKQTAKAREVFARCIAEINSMDSPDDREMLRLNDTARKLNRLAVSKARTLASESRELERLLLPQSAV